MEMRECIVYYESWQLQCCGSPFSVGDVVEWKGTLLSEKRDAHGITIDFEEEHHVGYTHKVKGTVEKIISERSEFPKGNRIVYYEQAPIVRTELQHADGWESDYRDDETTERTFWGYIVVLKDAEVSSCIWKHQR